jgi:hypothetical protein
MSTPDTEYRWIGIDVSKDHLDVYDLKQQTATRYVNDGQGVEQLWQACSGDANCAVVCEASGGYETLMVFRAFRSNHPCCWGILYPGNGGRNSLMLAIRLQFATFS